MGKKKLKTSKSFESQSTKDFDIDKHDEIDSSQNQVNRRWFDDVCEFTDVYSYNNCSFSGC